MVGIAYMDPDEWIKRLIARIKYERFCKANHYFCPDCIYHKFIFEDDLFFRGNDCQHPYWRSKR